ncbi:shikimate dehydrogenase family protein [Actinomadura rubrisoli]|uniref:Shikimate dehydrogenase (NADP(+)) n=1 Tax=Actinomadura rubrisoli TaxID=2530368 RepID=A0A4R5BQP8_9ACTN|nr:shikimate dehydrogenase [Actinomadura rubrisoli]TDD87836.1 shikimate dehydrogenase [Actinomadura rubrisoli]
MRTVALFGRPLRRRHSAAMHNAAFEAAGVDARYELREVDEAGLAEQVAEARRDRWMGFQITAPYKLLVMDLLDEIEPDARRIGAVNSVAAGPGGRLIGFNTDVLGFMAGVRKCLGGDVKGLSVVVAGSGGVGHAAVYGLATAGAGRLSVLDLDAALPRRLADDLGDAASIEALAFGDPVARDRLAEADLFVNATSVGMLSPGPVVDIDLLGPSAAVFDVVYIPAETELVRRARARGMRASNGDGMLVAQAAAAWCRWTGLPDPSETMRRAVAPLLAEDDPRP